MSPLEMKSLQFRQEREAGWVALEHLVEKIEKRGIRSLSAEELSDVVMLYKSTLSSLSVARSISLDLNLLIYLERLSARAYLAIYGTRRSFGRTVVEFLFKRFPRTVRAFRWEMLLAASFFLSGLLAGFIMTLKDPDTFYAFVPHGLQQGRGPTSTTEELRSVLYFKKVGVIEQLWAFATFLFTHNAQIGILAFALGIAVGVPVFYLLFTNGQSLGAMAAVYHQHGLSLEFWGWILPHGITEMGAMVLCGGAGLMIARAVIAPGRHTRLGNLAVTGRQSGVVVLGCVFMFFTAGLIEGLFRQMVHGTFVRYAVGAVTLTCWMYFFGPGQKR
jgi:uncharacterized membrane protein SpoIIM required for sporulation